MFELDIDDNMLTGRIPTEFGKMINAREIDLDCNQLSGPIPMELGYLDNLLKLNIADNKLTGSLPDELFARDNLKSLKNLWLSNNSMSGSLTSLLGRLLKLETLELD